ARIASEQSETISRLSGENSSLAARLESEIRAMNRIIETSSALGASRTAALQSDLNAETHRAAEMEQSYHRANSELQAIRRTPGWRFFSSIRRITARVAARADQRLIVRSGLFDRDWYAAKYPEVDVASDALLDYLHRGATEGRDPSPLFPAAWYLEQY